jgi:uncharacterized protein
VIFVDSSFWIALGNRRDAHHDGAVTLVERHDGTPLTTSNHVRGESWTFLRRRSGHRAAVGFLDMLERSTRVRLVMVSDELEAVALRWLRQHDEREYSFVDATSFVLMRAHRIFDAFAFDGDFSAAGFRELRAGD